MYVSYFLINKKITFTAGSRTWVFRVTFPSVYVYVSVYCYYY